MKRGYWTLIISEIDDGIDKKDQDTLDHIAELISQGYTEGEVLQEQESPADQEMDAGCEKFHAKNDEE